MLKAESLATNLPALPAQPADVPWPTKGWPRTSLPPNPRFETLVDEIFNLTGVQGDTHAFLVVRGGALVFERYNVGASVPYLQYSWSMAKSITQALTGILVKQGRLDIYAPAPVPGWRGDARREITVDQLLRMSSGLAFREDYVDGLISDVFPMLQFEGRHDTGAFAAAMPLEADNAALARVQDAVGRRPTWLAVSTHEGEERLAADVHRKIARSIPGLLTVIVPRHADRGDAIETDLTDRGFGVVRRSRNELPGPQADIFLGDSMGEMGLYLRLGNPVFVGKSLLHEGGHNPREPALLGRAVLFGPHMENFIQAANDLMAASGAIQVADAATLAALVGRLLQDAEAVAAMGAAGQARAEADASGILDAVYRALAPVVEAKG